MSWMPERGATFIVSFVAVMGALGCRPNDAAQESSESESESESESSDTETGDTETGDTETGETETGTSGLPETPTLELGFSQIKQFEFSWAPAPGAEYYSLLESADVGQDFVQLGADIEGESIALTMPLHLRINASYRLLACNMEGCSESAVVDVTSNLAEAVGYFKASNAGDWADWFGYRVALSGDGDTLAVTAMFENSSVTGIDGNQTDEAAYHAGAVYVFVRDGAVWSQQAYIKASNTGMEDLFGYGVALSDDGDTLAVGAQLEDGGATGIDGNQGNDWAYEAGAVYVFERSEDGVWSQQAYVKASNTDAGDGFGTSVTLSSDGDTLAVGAEFESSGASGIDGDQDDESVYYAGAVYVFERDGAVWSQQAYVKASNPGVEDRFGGSVALSDDGDTMVVGASLEDSSATGIDGDQTDESGLNVGAAYVFVRDGAVWSQQAYVKPVAAGGGFGVDVALSGDGNVMAIGANGAGMVYLFEREGDVWSPQTHVESIDTGGYEFFGTSVALSSDGTTLAVGAHGENSGGVGIDDEPPADEPPAGSESHSGAVSVFVREGDAWSHEAYVKASNTDALDRFGIDLTLSGDGTTLAVGASEEDSNATGIGGDQADNSSVSTGAVYLY